MIESSSGTGSTGPGGVSSRSQFVAGRGAAVSSVLVELELWRLWIPSSAAPQAREVLGGGKERGKEGEEGGKEGKGGQCSSGTVVASERLQRLWDVPGAHGVMTNKARGSWAEADAAQKPREQLEPRTQPGGRAADNFL